MQLIYHPYLAPKQEDFIRYILLCLGRFVKLEDLILQLWRNGEKQVLQTFNCTL